MIKITANPLVVAAAFGLLGPAALEEDDEDLSLGGLWNRADAMSGDGGTPARLGEQIQLVPIEGQYLLDEGTGRSALTSPWTPGEDIRQEFQIDGARVTREFHAEGDAMEVRTIVAQGDEVVEYYDHYTRVG